MKRDDRHFPNDRQRAIAGILKRAPNEGWSLTEIHQKLVSSGLRVIRKTVERDLDVMKGLSSHGKYPQRFTLAPNYQDSYEIELKEEQLQTLALAVGLLGKYAPAYFERVADDVQRAVMGRLPALEKKELSRFLSLQVVHDAAPGKAKLKSSESLLVVLKALRSGQTFECCYESQSSAIGKDPDRIRSFGPIIFEMAGFTPYILVQDLEDKKCKRLKISRISKANILPNKFITPPKNAWSEYLDSFGGLGGGNFSSENVTIKADDIVADFFENHEWHHTQKLVRHEDGTCTVTWKVPLSWALDHQLAGFGGHIHAIAPAKLKARVLELWKGGLAKFKN